MTQHRLSTVTLTNKILIFISFRSYTNLNNVVINRGKMLQTAVHSLQLFDRSMDQVWESHGAMHYSK